MSKKRNADDTAAEGTEPASKKATKKSTAKKPAAKKAVAKKPAPKKPARGKKAPPVIEVVEAAGEPAAVEEITDAEIIAETPLEAAAEALEEAELEVARVLTEEEQQLAAMYGEDLTAPKTAHVEYADRQTADEDRPMLPEINAREERKQHWQERREMRKRRREERQQRREGGGGEQRRDGGGEPRREHPRPNEQRPLERRPEAPPAMAAPTGDGQAPEGPSRVGTPLGDAAAVVFSQLRNGQPLPVRQLAAMMRKRSLVQQDPEQLWPQLKAELLGDERSYRTLGLRPRIVYRGRDLFAPGPVATSVTAEAEASVATALSRLAGETHRAFAMRLSRASAAGFERIIHAYLVAAGYRDIEWVKRVGGISYATALAPGLGRTILISARSGDAPIDRRGVGELRVGVEAKDLVAGILFAPTELSEDAERELERAGRSVAVVCGDQLVAALIAAGVGVVSSAAPLHYLDDQLLEELLAG